MAQSNLISPLLWQSIPFGDKDGWLDFLGSHEQWHRELARAVPTTPLTPLDDLRSNLLEHARIHEALWEHLSLPEIQDLEGYDLDDRDSYNGFAYVHSLDHQRLRLRVGL